VGHAAVRSDADGLRRRRRRSPVRRLPGRVRKRRDADARVGLRAWADLPRDGRRNLDRRSRSQTSPRATLAMTTSANLRSTTTGHQRRRSSVGRSGSHMVLGLNLVSRAFCRIRRCSGRGPGEPSLGRRPSRRAGCARAPRDPCYDRSSCRGSPAADRQVVGRTNVRSRTRWS
jgi:hypothetical protein